MLKKKCQLKIHSYPYVVRISQAETEEQYPFLGNCKFSRPLSCRQNEHHASLHVRRGSAIAKIVGANAAKHDRFVTTVNMWVFEETVNGRKLTEIINTDHENVKYLPGHKLPPNVVSTENPLGDEKWY